MKGFIATFLIIIIIAIVGGRVYKQIHLTQNCTGYLERAANANSVELAKKELDRAIAYAEANDLTSGYTSVLYRTPDEDVEFWYSNLKECQEELNNIDINASQLEKTNVLMKLRESLTDVKEKSSEVTYPDGLSVFPNNVLWTFLLSIAVISFIIFLFILEFWNW